MTDFRVQKHVNVNHVIRRPSHYDLNDIRQAIVQMEEIFGPGIGNDDRLDRLIHLLERRETERLDE